MNSLFVTHYFSQNSSPFRTISDLDDEKAVELMRSLYDESEYGERFKEPAGYLHRRRITEAWVRQRFIDKGRNPRDINPIYMVLGRSKWIESNGPIDKETDYIVFSMDLFDIDDISFTYPDSMISLWFSEDRPEPIKDCDLYGKVFDMVEIKNIISERGFPDAWDLNFPQHIAPYIEAQVWNREKIRRLYGK